MSQERQWNQDILDALNKEGFLGKVLTTTEEEMLACIRNEFPAPSEKQVTAGPVGTLNKFELGLLTQLSNANAATKKVAADFKSAHIDSEPDLSELIKKARIAMAEGMKHRDMAVGYKNLLNESINQRLPTLNKDANSYAICNDGNIYLAKEESCNCPLCGGSGEVSSIGALIKFVFGGSRHQ